MLDTDFSEREQTGPMPSLNHSYVCMQIESCVKAVWTAEPYGRSVFVSSQAGDRIHHEDIVETEGIRVDFAKVFHIPENAH